MPKHNHGSSNYWRGDDNPALKFANAGGSGVHPMRQSPPEYAGEGQPFTVMPPFLAVKYLIKVHD